MLVVIGIILGLMLNHVVLRPVLRNCEPAASSSASTPISAASTVRTSTMVPATPATIQQVGVYPCADPTSICDHLSEIGCSIGRSRSCRDTIAKLGEDVCLKLYETKYAPQVHALGVTCNP
jgi:hypothetical protein